MPAILDLLVIYNSVLTNIVIHGTLYWYHACPCAILCWSTIRILIYKPKCVFFSAFLYLLDILKKCLEKCKFWKKAKFHQKKENNEKILPKSNIFKNDPQIHKKATNIFFNVFWIYTFLMTIFFFNLPFWDNLKILGSFDHF